MVLTNKKTHLIAGRYPHYYYEIFDLLIRNRLTEMTELILDAGCGNGRVWVKPNKQVVGIDLNTASLKSYKNKASSANICKLPFRDGIFGLVLCAEVIEHVSDGVTLINELRRVIKKGGKLILTTSPILGTPMAALIPLKNRLHPHHAKEHINLQYPKVLLKNIKDSGFEIKEVYYWNVFSFTHYLSLFGFNRLAALWHKYSGRLAKAYLSNNIIISAKAV